MAVETTSEVKSATEQRVERLTWFSLAGLLVVTATVVVGAGSFIRET